MEGPCGRKKALEARRCNGRNMPAKIEVEDTIDIDDTFGPGERLLTSQPLSSWDIIVLGCLDLPMLRG